MYRFLVLFLLPILLLTATNAFAAKRQASDYFGFHVGATQAETVEVIAGPLVLTGDFGTGMNADLVLGHDYGDLYKNLGFRVEGMFGWNSPDPDATAYSAMLNIVVDIYNNSKFTPYLNAGVGGALVKYSLGNQPLPIDSTQDGYGFAYQGGAGFCYELTRFIDLELGYKYFAITSAKLDSGIESDFSTHNFIGGARFFW